MLVGRAGSAFMGIVLARLLAPEDFGVYAVALVVLNAVLSINELGVSLAIIRWPGDVGRIAPTVATIALSSSLLLYAACFIAAPVTANALGAPQASGVLRLLVLGVVVDALTAVPAALMTREFQQGRRLVVDTIGFVAVFAVSLTLALSGAGAWSLAWGMLAGSIVNGVAILLWAPARYRFGWRVDAARELLAFGLPLAAASLLVFGTLNVDYIVVGRELGPIELGLYLLAFNLSSWPVTLFSSPVRRVALAAFSRLAEEPDAARRGFTRAVVMLFTAAAPACLLLFIFAEPLIKYVYGTKWSASAGPLPFLAVLALTRVLAELGYDFLVALGRSRATMVVQAVWFCALLVALQVGVRLGGITGVAVAHAVVAVGVVIPVYALLVSRSGVVLGDMARQLRRPVLGLALAGLGGAVVLTAIPHPFLELAVGGIVVVVAYVGVVHPMRRLLYSPQR